MHFLHRALNVLLKGKSQNLSSNKVPVAFYCFILFYFLPFEKKNTALSSIFFARDSHWDNSVVAGSLSFQYDLGQASRIMIAMTYKHKNRREISRCKALVHRKGCKLLSLPISVESKQGSFVKQELLQTWALAVIFRGSFREGGEMVLSLWVVPDWLGLHKWPVPNTLSFWDTSIFSHRQWANGERQRCDFFSSMSHLSQMDINHSELPVHWGLS